MRSPSFLRPPAGSPHGVDPPPPPSGSVRGTRQRRWLRWLYRPLATDEQRALYWLRHTRIGVLLSVAGGLAALVYGVLLPDSPQRHEIVALAFVISLGSPAILLLPLREMVRDYRGVIFFYAWTVVDIAVIITGARWDGGARSPLAALLFLSLAFVTVAYPPGGVALMGTLMISGYLLVVCAGELTAFSWFIAAVMAAFTGSCALTSHNQWYAFDQQLLLMRAQEILASTDPLTGLLNRRALGVRLVDAIDAVHRGLPMLLFVIDLDGFKSVNDRSGHAAGDEVLQAVARALSGAVRQTDSVARLGGDEFAVVAAARTTDRVDPALVLAERIRAAVATAGHGCGVTGSLGLTQVRRDDDLQSLLLRADHAMYAAKADGGDLVRCGL